MKMYEEMERKEKRRGIYLFVNVCEKRRKKSGWEATSISVKRKVKKQRKYRAKQ